MDWTDKVHLRRRSVLTNVAEAESLSLQGRGCCKCWESGHRNYDLLVSTTILKKKRPCLPLNLRCTVPFAGALPCILQPQLGCCFIPNLAAWSFTSLSLQVDGSSPTDIGDVFGRHVQVGTPVSTTEHLLARTCRSTPIPEVGAHYCCALCGRYTHQQ